MDDLPLPLPFILDGAFKRIREETNLPSGACPEQWILEHPETMLRIQTESRSAGATVLCAPTAGANEPRLSSYGLGGRTADYNRALAALAQTAAAGEALVAGVLSGTGLPVPPLGHTSFETLVETYARQVRALEEAGVSLYVADSMENVAEARAALLAVRENTKKPILVTFACDEEGRTPTGGDILAALIICQGMGAFAFGIGRFSGSLSELAGQMERLFPYARIPLAAFLDFGNLKPPCRPEDLAAAAPALAKSGGRVFGATGATYLAALGEAIPKLDFSGFPLPEQDPDILYCASEREAQFISPLVNVGEEIEFSPNFVEDLLAAEEAPTGVSKILLSEEDDLDIFAENQYIIQDAICLSSDSPELMERALRLYNGRAFYDGTGDLDPEALAPLVEKYGLVVL